MAGTQPNILFILTDQQTARAMSCAGNAALRTPHMDRLAAEGVRFTRAFCTSPVCGPSRASMATGLMPRQHGLVYNHDPRFLDDERHRLPTFADGLRASGVSPYWIGKWHAQEFYPNRADRIHGFDFLLTDASGFCGLGLHMDAAVTARAAEFLARPPSRPFFLGVSWHNPHDICYWIMNQYRGDLDPVTGRGDLPPLPPNFERSPDEPEFLAECRARAQYGEENLWTSAWDETGWRAYLRAYHRLVERVDAELGILLDALDRSGLADDTLVVFTSDHGESCAAHRLVVKLNPYEEAISVPLIARLPGVTPPGTLCDSHFASGVDFAPTFLELAGRAGLPPLPGRSLGPFLGAPRLPGREFAVVDLDPDPARPSMTARVARTERFKYVAYSGDAPCETLYDLCADPGETRNVAGDPSYAPEIERHRRLLVEWDEHLARTRPAAADHRSPE